MKKKTKVILWVSGIALFILTIVILSFTLFGLKDVDINFKNETTIYASQQSKQEIIESGDFKKNKCVLFTSKNEYIDTLERKNPYLKVINIETKFPNKFIIHCVEREQLFSIKVAEDKYFICDSELKVLSITDDISIFNCISLSGEFLLTNKNAKAGDKVQFEKDIDLIMQVPTALKINNRTYAEQKFLFKSYNLRYNLKGEPILEIVDNNSFKIEIKNIRENLKEKFQCLFSCYSLIDVSKYNSEKLIIQKNNSNEIIAILSPIE